MRLLIGEKWRRRNRNSAKILFVRASIYVLQGDGSLNHYSALVEKNASLAVKKIEKKIPVADVDIVFYDHPAGAIPELGIGGYSPNPHTVLVSLDPNFKNFRQTVDIQIERILAHELHHCARATKVGYGKTLLEALITEGLADHFDTEVTGKNPQPWDKALTDKQIVKYLNLARKEFNRETYNHHAWFYGSKEENIFRWTGYSLGFWLVGKYLEKNPDRKPSRLYAVKAKEFKVR